MLKKMNLKDCIYSALFAAIIAVLGFVYIPLPFSPVPITGQTLAVMLAGSILTARQAAMSVTTFLLLGMAGVPVFAGGTSGLSVIAGPRGGYLIGFLVAAIVISLIRGLENNLLRLGISNFIGGIIIVYAVGVTWLNFVTGIGFYKAIITGALPFIPGDVFKACAATFIGFAVNKHLSRMHRS
ncbi:MAG: biotin transporter BioY [Ruminiclostridium sp.]|nr:biotin transporter BioY [Ruminiclostridium sp.]